MNLTDRQWDLLRTVVSNHQSNGGKEFYLTQNVEGWWINYSRGPSFRVVYPDLDELCHQELMRLKRSGNCYRGWPTSLGITTVHNSLATVDEPARLTTAFDSAFWVSRREEFENLPAGDYSLIWSTRPPKTLAGDPLPSHWSWWQFPDESFREHLSAIALKCAKALGRDSEDGWFDELRKADFVKFKLSGQGREKQPDGSMLDHQFGGLRDVVKHSITLCHVLEAAGLTHKTESSRRNEPERSSRFQSSFQTGKAEAEGAIPFRGIAEGAIALSQFWRERQAEFEKYQQQFRDLKAHWYVSDQTWWLQCGESCGGILSPAQQPVDVFKAIARAIIAGWTTIRAEIASKPWPHVAANAEPWEVWLDLMRARNWGFRVTGQTRCTKYEWDAGVKDGKSLNALRKESKYRTGDEDKNIHRRLPDGSLRRLTAKELKGKSSEDLQECYHWLEDGTIDHVFESCHQSGMTCDRSCLNS